MGLTVHYELQSTSDSPKKARQLLEQLRQKALDLPFKEVGEIVEFSGEGTDPVAHPAPVALLALDDAGVEAARATTLSDGSFALDLRPGSYRLHADAPAGSLPRIADTVVRVEASATRDHPIRTTVLGDTGIR